MKRFLVLVVMLMMLLSFSVTVLANGGSAVIPYWVVYNYNSTIVKTYVVVSNITDAPITGKLVLYNNDGTVFRGLNNIGREGGMTTATDDEKHSLIFTLSPKATTRIWVGNVTSMYGFGKIEWEQDSSAVHGLVCYGFIQQNDPYKSQMMVPINNGLPF